MPINTPKLTDEMLVAKLQSLAQASEDKIAALRATPTTDWQPPTYQAGVARTVGDVGIKLAQGVVDLGQSAVGVGSLLTGGAVGKSMRAIGYDPERTNAALSEYLSDSQKASDLKVQQAEGFIDTIKASLQNPRSILGSVSESAPGMLAGMGVAGAAARGIGLRAAMATVEGRTAAQMAIAAGKTEAESVAAALATDIGGKAAQIAVEAASGRLSAIGSGIEGAQSAGQIADQAQAAGWDYSDYALPAVAAGAITAGVGMASNKVFGDAATDLATGTRTLTGSKLARLAKEGFSEGVTEELPQSAQEQYFTNIAMGEPDHMKGVANAAGTGLVAGAAMGIGFGVLHGDHGPEHVAKATDPQSPEARQQFAAAAANNDISTYMDPQHKDYDPSTAVGVLLAHAMSPDATPEVKQKNLKDAGDIVAQLEESHTKAKEAVDERSDAGIQQAKNQLATVQDQLTKVDPHNTDRKNQLNGLVDVLNEHIADLGDKNKAMAARTELSKLDRQLTTSRARLEGLTTVAEPQATTDEVASLVDQVNTPATEAANDTQIAPTDRLINLSMTQPDALTGDQALKLADDKSNTFTDEQRAHLRAFNAARVAENQLSTTSKVSQEVFYGSSKNVGMAQYRARIATAIAAGNEKVATRQLALLQQFAEDHASKAKAARQAMQGGLGNQIAKLTDGSGWVVVPKGEKLDKATMDSNGALTMVSGRLEDNIQKEALALRATAKEMQSATSLKFGIAATAKSDVQSNSPTGTPDISSISLKRDERERETSRLGEPNLLGNPGNPSPPVESKPVDKVTAGLQRHANQEAALAAAQLSIERRRASKAAPRVTVGNNPDAWSNQNAQANRDIADTRGLTVMIEDAFAQGKTAAQVRTDLKDELKFLDVTEQPGFITTVRASLGIPSQATLDGQQEFATWKQAYDQRKNPAKSEAAQQPARTSAASTAPVAEAATTEAGEEKEKTKPIQLIRALDTAEEAVGDVDAHVLAESKDPAKRAQGKTLVAAEKQAYDNLHAETSRMIGRLQSLGTTYAQDLIEQLQALPEEATDTRNDELKVLYHSTLAYAKEVADKQGSLLASVADSSSSHAASPSSAPASLALADARLATAPSSAAAAGTLSVFTQEHDKSAPYTEQNLIGTQFQQKAGTDVLGSTGRPLALVTNFVTALKEKTTKIGDFVQAKEFSLWQKSVVRSFLASASAWSDKITVNLTRGNKGYGYEDMIQFLLHEDKLDLDENVKTAISYAVYSWVAENATRPAENSDEEINLILQRGEDALVSSKENEALKYVGTRQNVVANALGQRAVAALGLSSLASAPRNVQADLEASIGAHAMKLLLDLGMLERSTITGTEMAALTGKESTDNKASFYFLKLARTEEGLHPDVEAIYQASKGTKGMLDKLFGVEPGLKEPGTEPIKSTQKTTRNTSQGIPSELAEMVAKDDAEPSFVRQDMYNLVTQMDPEILLQIAGKEELDDGSVHKANRASLKAKNDGLGRELERFLGYVGQMGADVKMYFEHSVWMQQRVGIATNVVNPQTSKIHRHMLYRASWDTTIAMNDVDAMTNFKLRVAEGLGVKTDKKSQEKALADFAKLMAKPEIKGAVKVLVKTLSDQTNGKLSDNDQQVLLAGVKAGGEEMHSLDALMALAQFTKAKNNKETEFHTQLMAEVDGVTNGPMFSHLLLGAASTVQEMYALLHRGGFFEQGNAYTEYNNWRDAPGNFDLYENTALHMTQQIQNFIENGIEVARYSRSTGETWFEKTMSAEQVNAIMPALYAFTGELADKDGVVQKAGRNIIKTPLTMMVFGSSVKSAVDSMADKFISSIYAAIEDNAKGKEGALTTGEILTHLDNLGVTLPGNVNLMEHEFTPTQIKVLKEAFSGTLGKAVKFTMEKDFEVFIAQRTQFNQTAQLTFALYNAAYTGMREQMIADLVAKGEMAVNKTTGKPIHDLTNAQEKQLRKQLEALTPIAHTPMSKSSDELKAGVLVAKSDRKLSTSSIYQNTVKFGQPFADNGSKSSSVHGFEVTPTSPGVAMAPVLMHSADSAVSVRANPDGKAINVHDAQGAGVGGILATAKAMNAATWDTMLNYSPAAEITAALLRTVHGLDTLLQSGTVPEGVITSLASALVDFAAKQEVSPEGVLHLTAELAQGMAHRADSMKLDTMAIMQAVNQYAMEGGAYPVTDENRASAASLRSALAPSLSSADRDALIRVGDKLDVAIKAEAAKRDGKTVATDPEMDPKAQPAASPLTYATAPTNQSNAKLLALFDKDKVIPVQQAIAGLQAVLPNETRQDEFSHRLLRVIQKSVLGDVSVRLVTSETSAGDLLQPLQKNALGAYVSTPDGKHEINLQASTLQPEVMLHELTHAALARIIANPTEATKPLIAELEALLVEARKLDGKGQYKEALKDVQEMVAWGMTNAAFQQEILAKVQMGSGNTFHPLVTGMQKFISSLVKLIFGRPNDNMANGMATLITNVSGLFTAAAQNKGVANNVDINQSMAAGNLRDLSTLDIHNALSQMNSGRTVSSDFGTHLTGLLSGIVTKLHGPFGTFKAVLMEQTQHTPEQVYQHALATGQAPFALDALGAGFAFTDQEAFVAEQVQVTVKEAVSGKDGVTSVAYRELAKLYDEVRSKIKVSDFYQSTTPTPIEIAEAQVLHDFIFKVEMGADGRSDYLSRFASLGLAHEGFNNVLSSLVSKRAAGTAISFNDRLNKIFEQILNWFAGKMTNTKDGQTADKKLTVLVEQLVAIEARKRMVVQAKVQYLQPIEEKVNSLTKEAKKKLEEFGKKPFFQQHTNPFVRAAGALTSAYAGDRMDAIMEGFNRLRDQHFQSQQGILASLVNEFRGSNTSNLLFHFLLRASKHIEGMRKDIITGTGKAVLGSFANGGDDLTIKHKAAISAVYLRTDMGSLLAHYNMSEIAGLVNDKQRVQAEINRFEANLTGPYKRYYINAAKTLAYYKAMGKVTSAHMVTNAGNIARLYGTGYQTRVSEAEARSMEKVIDPLVSLYALAYSKDEHLRNAQEVLRAENQRTDGGNGVEMVLKTHQALVAKSKELLFEDAATLHMKGYTSEIYDPFMSVVVANQVDGDELVLRGYKKGDPVQHDAADPLAEAKHIYHLRDGGLQRRVTGTVSFTGMGAKGARVHNGNVSPLSYSGQLNASNMAAIGNNKQAEIKAMFTQTGFDPRQVQAQHLAPVLNANGQVVNYRYLMTEKVKDTLLDRDNRPEKILGAMAGSIFDKVESKKQNRKVIEALHEQYTAEFAERPEAYMDVGPASTDPQLREIWRLLPESTKQAVREIWGSENMKVRNDLLDINFGYRKVSVADAFTEQADQRNFVQTMFVEIATAMFHEKAELRVRQAEDIWQAIVKATKGNLVVKSWSTMSGNLRSNWSQLLLMGVNPIAIAKSHRVAFKGAWAYKKDSEQLFNLQHQLQTGYLQPGQTKANIEHEIKRLQDGINRNPVKPLIDAGLMPTIVEDVAADDDIYSYKSRFVKKTEAFTDKINPNIVGIGKFLLMTEDSSAFKVMSYATQISDFLARYTLYEHMTSKTNPMEHEEAIQLASDAFINYDVPTHRMVQYANDSGLVMFTKYYMRIQKMLSKIYKEHPGRVIAMMMAEKMLGDQPTVLDSGMLKRWGNPLNLGALDYPGSLDSLTTVKLLTSPFRGGGNPAD